MTNPLFFYVCTSCEFLEMEFCNLIGPVVVVKGLSYLLANEADVWFCNIEWERQKNAYR